MDKNKRIKILNDQISNCRKCPGLNIPKETMSAPGYGSINAELFVIGQSLHSYNSDTPDRQVPFVGPVKHQDSGIILYDALDHASYSFANKNLFITNLVHCHPPGNRASKLEEKVNCFNFLIEEIDIVKPKIILALGMDVINWFQLKQPMNGKYTVVQSKTWQDRKKIWIAAYHPSYIMRFGEKYVREKYSRELTRSVRKAAILP